MSNEIEIPVVESLRSNCQSSSLSIFGPLKIAVAYIVLTIILHFLGPWDYQDESTWLVLAFMIPAIGLLVAGYWAVAKRWRRSLIKDDRACARNYRRFKRWAMWGLVLQSGVTFLDLGGDFVAGQVSLSALLAPGQVYIDALEASKQAVMETSILGQIKTLLSPLFLFSNTLLIFNFGRISRKWRILLVSTIFLQLLHGVLVNGAQKGVFDAFILLVSIGVLKIFLRKDAFVRWRRYILLLLFFVVAVFVFFQVSRMSAYGALDYSGSSLATLDRGSWLFVMFGDLVGLGLALFVGYISQGYYGLSLSLQLPFEWSYGLGNSFSLTSYAEQYFGVSGIFERTYPHRMEQVFNWPAKMYWHTIFPWLASDITFPGVLILMFFIGRAYARSLIDSVVYESPLGMCVFYLLTTLLLYLPGNNQLMQTREMMIATVVLVGLWIIFGSAMRKGANARRPSSSFCG